MEDNDKPIIPGSVDCFAVCRAIRGWEWYNDSHMVHILIHIIGSVNHEDRQWRGIVIRRGQFVASVRSISEATLIPIKIVRNCLDRLEKGGYIRRERANKTTVITLCNIDCSAQHGQQKGKQTGNERANKITPITPCGNDSYEHRGQTKGNERANKWATKGQDIDALPDFSIPKTTDALEPIIKTDDDTDKRDAYREELENDAQRIEAYAKSLCVSQRKILDNIERFAGWSTVSGQRYDNYNDYCKHYYYWLAYELRKTNGNTINNTTKQRQEPHYGIQGRYNQNSQIPFD